MSAVMVAFEHVPSRSSKVVIGLRRSPDISDWEWG